MKCETKRFLILELPIQFSPTPYVHLISSQHKHPYTPAAEITDTTGLETVSHFLICCTAHKPVNIHTVVFL